MLERIKVRRAPTLKLSLPLLAAGAHRARLWNTTRCGWKEKSGEVVLAPPPAHCVRQSRTRRAELPRSRQVLVELQASSDLRVRGDRVRRRQVLSSGSGGKRNDRPHVLFGQARELREDGRRFLAMSEVTENRPDENARSTDGRLPRTNLGIAYDSLLVRHGQRSIPHQARSGSCSRRWSGRVLRQAYGYVADSDEKGTSPGSEVFVNLFKKYGPVLVLIDEWVAYEANIATQKRAQITASPGTNDYWEQVCKAQSGQKPIRPRLSTRTRGRPGDAVSRRPSRSRATARSGSKP